jgi:hypothetical protein
MNTLLFEVTATDPLTYVSVVNRQSLSTDYADYADAVSNFTR